MHTNSGFPSPVISVKVGDSLSVWLKITWRFHDASPPFGFSNHDVSFPGNPMMRMSFQPSLLKSCAQAKKLSEYLFATPNAPSNPGTVTAVCGPNRRLKVAVAG